MFYNENMAVDILLMRHMLSALTLLSIKGKSEIGDLASAKSPILYLHTTFFLPYFHLSFPTSYI